MILGVEGSRTRCALVWGASTAAAVALTAGLLPVLGEAAAATRAGGLEEAGFAAVLVWGSAAVAATVTAWLWLVTSLVVADAARGATGRRRGVPDGVRRAVLVLCGVAVTAGLASPAHAAGGAPDPGVLAGLRLPERVGVADTAPHARPAPVAVPSVVRVVRPGDTLWSLTAERLGPDASAAAIAAAWPRVYAANRDVIGPDPDRIEPGQRLVLPTAGA